MSESTQDRRLPATERKIQKSRKEGQLARSRDLGHVAVLGVGISMLAFNGPELRHGVGELMRTALRFGIRDIQQPSAMVERLGAAGWQMAQLLTPVIGGMVVAALLASVLVGGWNFTTQPLKPDFKHINPLSGLQRMFSPMSLVTTLKSCFLAVLLGLVATLYLNFNWPRHLDLLAMPLPAAIRVGANLILGGLAMIVGLIAIFALVDVPLQRQLLLRRLRMSVQEMKKEMKEVEGNAEIKARLKQRMREISSRRMMAAIPLADLVVMNPTHYAVALKYDEASMAAPRVVAKGADLLALRIRDLAQDSRVPVLQAAPLARALYAHCEVDQEIPARLFGAVAQVLAWVYQVRDAVAAGRALPVAAPVPEVPADLDPQQAAGGLRRRR